jgi:hypothetical protein
MTLYTDIPTRSEIDSLWQAASPASVSLYVPTEPESSGDAERIAFKNLTRAALDQLAHAPKDHLVAVEEALADLEEDDDFWRHQARTLAVFATPGGRAPSGCRTGWSSWRWVASGCTSRRSCGR